MPAVLWIISLASAFLALKASDEPIVELCRDTAIAGLLRRFPTGNSVVFDLSIGFLVSVIFYLLVVWFPARQKKNLIKRTFEEQYRYFKEDTIAILLRACATSYESDLPKTLSDQNKFRDYFKEPVSESQNRWHSVLNGLDERLLKDLLVELEILMHEVRYVLDNVDIDDPKVFSFFKRLSQAVYKLKNFTLEYDDVKQLSGFLWDIFAGFSIIKGYRENDIIEDMIKSI